MFRLYGLGTSWRTENEEEALTRREKELFPLAAYCKMTGKPFRDGEVGNA